MRGVFKESRITIQLADAAKRHDSRRALKRRSEEQRGRDINFAHYLTITSFCSFRNYHETDDQTIKQL